MTTPETTMDTILLVPSPQHRDALLGGDECGGAVPTMWCTRALTHEPCIIWTHGDDCEDECVAGPSCGKRVVCDWCGEPWPCPKAGQTAGAGKWVTAARMGDPLKGCVVALVLAHRGVPLPIGCDRAARVSECCALLATIWTMEDVADLVRECEAKGLGAVVVVPS